MFAVTPDQDGTFAIAKDVRFGTQEECRAVLRESAIEMEEFMAANPQEEKLSISIACVHKDDTLEIQY
jgi:hypothetical protein